MFMAHGEGSCGEGKVGEYKEEMRDETSECLRRVAKVWGGSSAEHMTILKNTGASSKHQCQSGPSQPACYRGEWGCWFLCHTEAFSADHWRPQRGKNQTNLPRTLWGLEGDPLPQDYDAKAEPKSWAPLVGRNWMVPGEEASGEVIHGLVVLITMNAEACALQSCSRGQNFSLYCLRYEFSKCLLSLLW